MVRLRDTRSRNATSGVAVAPHKLLTGLVMDFGVLQQFLIQLRPLGEDAARDAVAFESRPM